jgi:hypothetical protein
MSATLEQIKTLERIYTEGYADSFLDQSLEKIIAHQQARDQADLALLEQDLYALEQEHGMASEEFHRRYTEGELGDEAEFVEWNALYKMMSRLRTRLDILQGREP